MLQYSPESFSMTEVEFAKEISEAVMDVWQTDAQHKMILNLPGHGRGRDAEMYADQIGGCARTSRTATRSSSACTRTTTAAPAWPRRNWGSGGRGSRGGTLFGNGERTGNLDIVTVALNLYMHGIDPKLDSPT